MDVLNKRLVGLAALAFLGGCVGELAEPVDVHGGDMSSADETGISSEGLSLSRLRNGCSTAGPEGLSRQLVAEMQCLSGGAMVEVSHPNIQPTHSRVHLLLSPQGRDMLLRVARNGNVIRVNSGLRTIAEQYVLQRGCRVAATPGRSPHETGQAIDVQNYGTVGRALRNAGFSWPLPSSDPVHYVAPGEDLRHLSVLAFQRLWNANNPGDTIDDDGFTGPETLSRLARAPAEGFPIGSVCGASSPSPAPAPEPAPTPDAGSCTHALGGTFGANACSSTWQCCGGTWRDRGACGACACVEGSGEVGCTAAAPAPTPAPSGASCTHSYGGRYADTACSTSWQCCDGDWRSRGSCGSCACVEGTGERGCGT